MEDRFSTITKSECRLYTEGSPVVLSAYALLKDNTNDSVLTQLKFANVGPKEIRGLSVRIKAYDLFDTDVQGVEEYQYLDLKAKRGECFGQKKVILMPCNVTRRIEIWVRCVAFADGTTWRPAGENVWETIPQQETVNTHFGEAELAKQYGIAVGEVRCNYMPKQHKDLYLCTCGATSHNDGDTCHSCNRSFETLFSVTDEKIASDCAARLAAEKAEREAAEKKTKKGLFIAIPAVLVVILAIALVTKVFIPNNRYNAALALKDAGQYEQAIAAFEAMDGYKDSAEQLEECIRAESINAIRNAVVGDIITFGSYEQDNNAANGKEAIEWLVLAKESDRILVISKYALDCQPYNTGTKPVTWETCTLRTWLNGAFVNEAFASWEQAYIPTVTVTAEKNPEYNTTPGNDTKDMLFLLSIAEAEKYYASDAARQCAPSAYAKAQGTYTSTSNKTESGAAACWWWLRSPGRGSSYAAIVYGDGLVYDGGNRVDYGIGCVRPALWFNLET